MTEDAKECNFFYNVMFTMAASVLAEHIVCLSYRNRSITDVNELYRNQSFYSGKNSYRKSRLGVSGPLHNYDAINAGDVYEAPTYKKV